MRMRKKKNGEARLALCSDYFLKDKPYTPNGRTMLEIGCGKGGFITATAVKNPEITFIAMEKISDVILLAAEKIKAAEIKNVKFLNSDASLLLEHLAEKSIERIYLNFSDPWQRSKHAKRRLSAPSFLEIYKKLLVKGGSIHMKTDNLQLFEFSIESLRNCGFNVKNITYDLHNSEFEEGNIHTEYEDNFASKGFKINRLEAYWES